MGRGLLSLQADGPPPVSSSAPLLAYDSLTLAIAAHKSQRRLRPLRSTMDDVWLDAKLLLVLGSLAGQSWGYYIVGRKKKKEALHHTNRHHHHRHHN